MQIGGLQKFSTIDYPGKLSCIIFCQGCPLRCVYCHNDHLQPFVSSKLINEDYVFQFLEKRVGLLDAVVFSGGEPLSQIDLYEKMFHVKHFCYLIGLHTSGCSPQALKKVLPLLDWVGLDIKMIFPKYKIITGNTESGNNAYESLKILINNKIKFEVRTTYDSRYMTEEDLKAIAYCLSDLEIHSWVIQQCILRNDNREEKRLPLPNLETLRSIIDIEVRQ